MAGPVIGEEYIFYVSLTDIFDPQFFLNNPTIVSGDFKRSNDGGALTPLATLPIVEPAGSKAVKIELSPVEMATPRMTILGSDQSGDEWGDVSIFLDIAQSSTDQLMDIIEGDHIETRDRLIINRKNTTDPVLDKNITGSLLSANVTVKTAEAT